MTAQMPLLSVCIPAYNRPDWLRVSLMSLIPMMQNTDGRVEVVVSDDCSPDNGATERLVAEMQSQYPIRFHRHAGNIGSNPNILFTVRELARGEYAWVIGDDDAACGDILTRLVSVLTARPELDFVYVNHLLCNSPTPLSGTTPQSAISVYNPDFDDRYLPQLREIIPTETNCFTAMYSLVLRRALAADAFQIDTSQAAFASVETVVAHAVYVIQHLLHRPAWYLGQPGIIASTSISWQKYRAQYNLVLMHDLYDLMQTQGIDASVLDTLRRQRLQWSPDMLREMLSDPGAGFRDQFSLWQFIQRHARFPELWTMLQHVAVQPADTGDAVTKLAA